MDITEIISFLKNNIEPLPIYDGSKAYSCSAFLKDDLYLPCIQFLNLDKRINLAIRRFKETQPKLFGLIKPNIAGTYEDIISVFVAKGNRINEYDIISLEPSPYAIPLKHLKEIKGETSMGWTGFDAIMKDSKRFSFGTTYSTDFFNMPSGYTTNDIIKIIPHERGTKNINSVFRERPFFECYINGI
jgi:hypothetical protein